MSTCRLKCRMWGVPSKMYPYFVHLTKDVRRRSMNVTVESGKGKGNLAMS